MKEMKKILSAVLMLSMMLSMIVLPVSATQTYDYTPTLMKAEQYETFELNQTEATGDIALLSPSTTTESGLRATGDVTVAAIEDETVEPIALDQPIAVDIPTHEKIKYAFTPEEDGTYIVHTDAQNSPIFVVRQALSGAELTGTRWIRPAAAGGGYAYRMNKDTTYIIELENRHLYPSISGNLAVNKAELYQSLEITGDSVSFAGGTASLWITGSPVFAMETLTCTSSDPAIAQITSASNSYVTLDCLSPGTVTVTVTAPGGASASCELTVKQPLTLTQDKALLLQIPYGMEETVEFTPTESGRYIFQKMVI